MEDLPNPPKEAIYYEDEKLYVCLASFPITKGHSVVVWKERREDLQKLNKDEYDYLMNIVDTTRNVLLKFYSLEKVYLLYLDEIQHVHWHIVPRYDEQGLNILVHTPKEKIDFSDALGLKQLIAG
jgi:diadenosine tetraphosphate (Ap4A) HIT family hydrolase